MSSELKHEKQVMAFEAFGREMVPHLSGALYWPGEDALLVADLHLGQGHSLAARGSLIPPYDTHATLIALERVVRYFAPRRVICLGDSFHDDAQPTRLTLEEAARLKALMAGRDWLWLTGNHDPSSEIGLGGDVAAAHEIGGLTLAHHPIGTGAEAEARGVEALVCGHLHPAAVLHRGGRQLRRKCFALSARQMVLPAFGSYTGGLNINHSAFGDMRACPAFRVWLLGERAVYALKGDALSGG